MNRLSSLFRSPQTNGVIERYYESVKYEHLFGLEIPTGLALATEAESYRVLYNDVRPHEHLAFGSLMEAYLAPPESNLFPAESVQET